VVPKAMRDELGLTPDTSLEIEVVDDRIEISNPLAAAPRIVEGRYGPVIASTGATITDDDIRRILDAVRERR
jgi:bifunctional DNA-binding transcriptional regulator/antitoxin component of YhaV-PrlF toxin-antitoxin module